MITHHNIDHLPSFRNAVVTIGTFDGVHTGHQQILEQLRQEAARINGETVIITFHPHPRKIVSGTSGKEIKLINTLREKTGLLSWKKLDHLVIVPFTEDFSQLSAEQYIREFLLAKFHPHTVIIGYDHQFGKGRQGNYQLLESFSKKESFQLQEIPVHLLNEISVSSTRIREAVGQADIDTANHLLGYDFFFSGRVMEGDKLGRTIGYPTANLQPEDPEKLTPGNGVYAVELIECKAPAANQPDDEYIWPSGPRENQTPWKGMMNIGTRPTVGGIKRTIEVNLFDFNGDLYGKELRVFVKKHLRAEQKFNGLDALKAQLAIDSQNAREILNAHG